VQVFGSGDGFYADEKPAGVCAVDGRSCGGSLSYMTTISHELYSVQHLEGNFSIT